MTLRHRLLLVYLIVVLLSVATVGAAVLELGHARRIFGTLQPWNELALAGQKLDAGFPPPEIPPDGPDPFLDALVRHYPLLAEASEYRNVDRAREALTRVRLEYEAWLDTRGSPANTAAALTLRNTLRDYTRLVEDELYALKRQAREQDTRRDLLVIAVIALTVLHIVLVGWLLRRWLLWPMERLNRQVEALARDQPPSEPLLTAPRELAALATALDKARESLGALRRQVLEAERMTTIGQFAAQLAHNLRNPLASIRAAAQITSRHVREQPYVAERMGDIMASVDRLNQWIAGLMEVARREPTPVRRADVVPTLKRVKESLAAELAAKELTLTLDAPEGGLWCGHDPATLEHALIAMVTNAIEASPLSGAIRLEAGRRGDRCRIAVIDAGSGLPGDDPERIFEFAYSTKSHGMGLGLALARQSLERQGGATHAYNHPDGGAVVYVELPLAEDAATPAAGVPEDHD